MVLVLLLVGPLLGLLILTGAGLLVVRAQAKRKLRKSLEHASYGLTAQWGGPGDVRSDW